MPSARWPSCATSRTASSQRSSPGAGCFVVSEALTNVAKHARAGHAEVMARIEDGTLAVKVRDDGMGGARPDGSGLVGLADRLAALHGRLCVQSPADGGTLIAAAIPLAGSVRAC